MIGVQVQLAEVLDVIEALFRVSEHPDVADVERYSGAMTGMKVRYGTGSSGLLFGDEHRGEIRIGTPDPLPPWQRRAPRTAILALQLLDAARPAAFRAWYLTALPSIGHDSDQVSGLRIECGDGASVQLRATGMGSQTPEPEEDPALDYRIPEGVGAWQQASAVSAGRP